MNLGNKDKCNFSRLRGMVVAGEDDICVEIP